MENYNLVDASAEDNLAFKQGLEELLSKLSLHLSLIINKKAIGIKLEDGTSENGFIDQPSLLLQKKVEKEILSPIQNDTLEKN